MPYANFLRISLGFILALAILIILLFSWCYFVVSVYSPTGGVLADYKPVLPKGFHASSWWDTGTAFLQCIYLSVVTFGSLGHTDVTPGAIAKFFVVAEIFCGVSTMGVLVAKIVSYPGDQIRSLRRSVINSWWIDRVEDGIAPNEDLFGLLKFETDGIYGIRYHGTDYNKSGKVVNGFEAILTEIEMPTTSFRVPTTFAKDHGPALVTLMFLGDHRNRFNRFQGSKRDLNKPDQTHMVHGHKISNYEYSKLDKSAVPSQAMVELIGRYFPGDTG